MDTTPVKGQKVYFGRSHGERTLGEVVGLGRTRAKVKQLEARGTYKAHAVGTVWTVPFKLLTEAPADAKPAGGTWGQDSGGAPVSADGATDTGGTWDERPRTNGEAFARMRMQDEISRLRRENEALKARNAAPRRSEDVIMMDIDITYSMLSPENLSCDGELRGAALARKARGLRAKLAGLFAELGKSVTEEEAYAYRAKALGGGRTEGASHG